MNFFIGLKWANGEMNRKAKSEPFQMKVRIFYHSSLFGIFRTAPPHSLSATVNSLIVGQMWSVVRFFNVILRQFLKMNGVIMP